MKIKAILLFLILGVSDLFSQTISDTSLIKLNTILLDIKNSTNDNALIDKLDNLICCSPEYYHDFVS